MKAIESRRDFIKAGALFGGGLVLAFCLPAREAGARGAGGSRRAGPFVPNAFLRIGPDETVTVILGKSEMGQGVYTALPMLVAEELEADWTKVRVEAAPVDPAYNSPFGIQMTGGSTSVATTFEPLRRAGATARVMLVAAAAKVWKVAPESCRAERGAVVHEPSGRRLTYGRLAQYAVGTPVPEKVALKDPKDFKLIGKPTPRLDSREKVTGECRFGLDVRLPGMLTAVVCRPPVFGAKAVSFDAEKAKALPGVRAVVPVDSGVAVVADTFWAARQARDAVVVKWGPSPADGLGTPELRAQYRRLLEEPGTVARKEGDAAAALATAARRIDAVYEVPYLAHAPMEPLNCTADWKPGRCAVWTGTQFQTVDRNAAAKAAGLKPEQVAVHTTYLGGGFGRRANPASDFVPEAVQASKAVGKPVKVVWTREDDVKGGYYRPMAVSALSAGVDAEGRPVAWTHRLVGQSILAGTPFDSMVKDGIDATSVEGAADLPYAIPNLLVELHTPKVPVPVLWWRSVGHSQNAFLTEGFVDELAHLAGKDPFELRRGLLEKHPRHRAVLELAAEKAGWGRKPGDGIGRGIAVHESFKSFVAQVADVSVDAKGQVRVHRIVCAVDCGVFVNPLTVEAQIQGAVAFGLGAALHSAVTLKDGRVEQGNFDDYRVLRLPEMPRVEVHLVKSTEAPGGIGEPGVPPTAPAVVNAVFALTGKRLRQLPIDPATLKG